MKKYISTICVPLMVALFSLPFTSCLDTETKQTEYYTAIATVLLSDSIPTDSGLNGYPYYFLTDNSKILVPANYSSFPTYKPSFNDRIVITYSLFSIDNLVKSGSKATQEELIDISIAEINTIYSKDILNTDKPDTLANNLIDIPLIWISGGKYNTGRFLNLAFNFHSISTSYTHNFFLVNDLTRETPVEDDYYLLNFRHDSNQDTGSLYNLFGYICFPIDKYYSAGLKGLKISYLSYTEGEKQVTIPFEDTTSSN